MRKIGLTMAFVMAAVMITSLTGCYKPYQVEKSIVVQPYQTAYLVPKEGNTGDQGKLDSVAAYEACKVASKRIIIPTRWNQTGRGLGSGEWIKTMALIIVDRTPVSLHWTPDADTGTNKINEAIWLESSNSIAFSIPFAMTAYIKEADASTYLFYYNRGTLFEVLNTEGRNKVMEVAAEYSNSMALEELLTHYSDINAKVSEVVVGYFAKRGVTITSLGISGYATYRNPDNATAIDNVFKAQQLEAVELAKSKAAEKHQAVMEADGKATAAKTREASRGPMIKQQKISEAEKTAAGLIGDANGQAVITVSDATLEAMKSPTFVKLMGLDVETQRVEKWDGQSPIVVSGPNDFVPANSSK